MLTIGFIGAGQMAQAMVKGWQKREEIHQVVYAPTAEKQVASELGIQVVDTPAKVWEQADMVVLAMKPQDLQTVADELRLVRMQKPEVIIVSVLAGVTLKELHQVLGERLVIARAVSNINVALRYGYTGLAFDQYVDASTRGAIAMLFLELGKTDEYPEQKLSVVSALAGSGPAFVAAFVKSYQAVGQQLGLTEDQAQVIALQTLTGTGINMTETPLSATQLANLAIAAGVSTNAGYSYLTQGQLEEVLSGAVSATMDKNEQGDIS